MSHVLEVLSYEAITSAMEGNLCTFANYLGRSSRLKLHDDPDVTWFVSNVPFPLLNQVVFARFEPGKEDSRIEQILAEFNAAGVPMLWWTGPASRPHDISSHLEQQGLTLAGSSPGMAADLTQLDENEPLPEGLTVERLAGSQMLQGFGQVLQDSFGIPDFVTEVYYDIFMANGFDENADVQNYVGYLQGKPVAACTVTYGAGVAGIYNVATLPEARGRGIGRAITLKPLLDARQRGYKVAVLESSDLGYSVYKRLGFEDYCQIQQYIYIPPAG